MNPCRVVNHMPIAWFWEILVVKLAARSVVKIFQHVNSHRYRRELLEEYEARKCILVSSVDQAIFLDRILDAIYGVSFAQALASLDIYVPLNCKLMLEEVLSAQQWI